MATIMEKDVLLEYAHLGHLVMDMEKTKEIDDDLTAMGALWREILGTDERDIDYQATIKRIKAIRNKYEND